MGKPWFRAKKYGYGWGLPLNWQGWTVFGAYLVGIAVFIILLSFSLALAWTIFFADTIAFIVIVWAKGEKLQWRWGNKS